MNSRIIIYKAKDSISGQIRESSLVAGLIIKCMDLVLSPGSMEGSMKENTLTIKKRVKEFSSGLTAKNTMVNGKMVNSTELESSLVLRAKSSKVDGRMEKEWSG